MVFQLEMGRGSHRVLGFYEGYAHNTIMDTFVVNRQILKFDHPGVPSLSEDDY